MTRAKGPRLVTSIVVLVGGALLTIPGIVMVTLGLWHGLSGLTYSIPGTARAHLGSGTYLVFERTDGGPTEGPSTDARAGVTLNSSQLRVTGPDGRTVRVRNTSPDETVTDNSVTYTSALQFTTPGAGEYQLRFRTTVHGQVRVQRPLGDVLLRAVPWIIEIVLAALTAAVGLVMLVVGVIRRSTSDPPPRGRAGPRPRRGSRTRPVSTVSGTGTVGSGPTTPPTRNPTPPRRPPGHEWASGGPARAQTAAAVAPTRASRRAQ